MVTIRDVARAAKVSSATVSRVLNQSALISVKTKETVQRAIKDLGFVPNVVARNLASQRSCTIGLLIDIENARAYSNPFFTEVLHGIETVVYSEGYFLIIANEKTISHQKISIDHLVLEKRIDGLILPYPSAKRGLIRKLDANGFPFVIIGEPDESRDEVDFVDINNELGGEQAVHHLVQNGYRRIAFIGGNRGIKFVQNRLTGYAKALRQHGLPLREELIQEERGEITKTSGFALTKRLFTGMEPPDALVCTDNILAWGALNAVKEQGLKVPEEVGIVSFDNFPLAEFLSPPLTTVDIDVFALGVQAASILMKRLKMVNLPHQQSIVSTKLVERDSSIRRAPGPAAEEGPP